jgi:signal transduction histidine kinase
MEMWPGVEHTEVFRKMKTCMEERTLQKFENEFVFPDGAKGWYDLKIIPVPEGIFIFSMDIAERKRIQKEEQLATEILRHLNRHSDSEQMLNSIVHAIKIQMDIELVGIRLKDDNRTKILKTYGFSEKLKPSMEQLCVTSLNNTDKLANTSKPSVACLCNDILKGKFDDKLKNFTTGGSFCLADKTQKNRLKSQYAPKNNCNSFSYESMALIPLKSGNQIVGLLQLLDSRSNVFSKETITFLEGLSASIGIALMRNRAETELKQLNADLEQRIKQRTQKLLESNKELESFAYSVSHDLRAPLRHVIGFSEKLGKYLAEKEDPEVLRLTGKISSSASRMGNLIDELLTYSRLGKTDLNLQSIASSTIVDAVIAETVGLSGEKPVEWKIGNLPMVFADKTSLQLVFQNLINNALKFSGKNNKIEIEIGCNDVDKKEYQFFVKDNGVGFNMDYYNNLFGVFQRLHSANEFEGTGIGLASVRRIINRHNGRVWAESKENTGATFYFTLPKNLNSTNKN